MAIRKPTAPAEKSAVFAEFLAGAGKDNSAAFKTGSKVEGTVSAVKGDDVFVDIGYKSEGIVSLGEFSDPAEVKPGLKFQVKLLDLEDDKTGMVRLSKKAADDEIRWEKVQAQYTEGCVVTGTIQSAVRGGLLVDIDGVEAFLPGSHVDVTPARDLAPYIGQTYDFKVMKISDERRNIIVSRRELIAGAMEEKKAELLHRPGRHRRPAAHHRHELGPHQASERAAQGRAGARRDGARRRQGEGAHLARPQADDGEPVEHDRGPVPGRRAREGQGREPRRLRRVRGDRPRHRGARAHQRVQLDEARGASERHAQHRRRGARLRAAGRRTPGTRCRTAIRSAAA